MGKIEKFALPIEPLHQSPRKVWVYLPDSYATSKKKYPVLVIGNWQYDNKKKLVQTSINSSFQIYFRK